MSIDTSSTRRGEEEQKTNADVISILIATDNHLGYLEKDPVRGQDSFQTFEEILHIAQDRQVDIVLLGGDLFHDNKPSRKSLHSTLALLRENCMGDRPCSVDILSDQSINFPHRFAFANYFDPNLNVSLPIFSIHGNHDDPNGDGGLCALDLLSVAGFVNYFGKANDVDDITVSPILLQKGDTKLALYGLGNVRDERLNRTFKRGKVKLMRPHEEPDSWFNLFVIHQNRVAHGPNNHIPDTFIDDFIDLILWGHEHECLIDPQQSTQQHFIITQPGSSVATSLSEGESVDKHVGILKICEKSFKLEKVKLKTVRPFIIHEIALKDQSSVLPTDSKGIFKFLTGKVESMIQETFQKWKLDNQDSLVGESDFMKPLIRLKVEYSGGYATFNPHRFGQQFVDRVANPKDILLFYRRKTSFLPNKRLKANKDDVNAPDEPQEDIFPEIMDRCKVEDLVQEYLEAQQLDLLPEHALGDAVKVFVEKDDKDAIKNFVSSSLANTRKVLKEKKVILNEEEIKNQVHVLKKQINDDDDDDDEGMQVDTTVSKRRNSKTTNGNDGNDGNDRFEDDLPTVTSNRCQRRGVKSKSSSRLGTHQDNHNEIEDTVMTNGNDHHRQQRVQDHLDEVDDLLQDLNHEVSDWESDHAAPIVSRSLSKTMKNLSRSKNTVSSLSASSSQTSVNAMVARSTRQTSGSSLKRKNVMVESDNDIEELNSVEKEDDDDFVLAEEQENNSHGNSDEERQDNDDDDDDFTGNRSKRVTKRTRTTTKISTDNSNSTTKRPRRTNTTSSAATTATFASSKTTANGGKQGAKSKETLYQTQLRFDRTSSAAETSNASQTGATTTGRRKLPSLFK